MFTISDEQYEKYTRWRRELEERIAREQLESKKFFGGQKLSKSALSFIRDSLERGEPHPYYGGIGGAYREIGFKAPHFRAAFYWLTYQGKVL